MSNIEGIPEGWDLVRVGMPVKGVDWLVDPDGKAKVCDYESMYLNRVIISKTEKPKQYRPFANAAEAMLFWDSKVRPRADGSCVFRIVAIGETTAGIGFSLFSFTDAFNSYEFDDGSPFGVEVQE